MVLQAFPVLISGVVSCAWLCAEGLVPTYMPLRHNTFVVRCMIFTNGRLYFYLMSKSISARDTAELNIILEYLSASNMIWRGVGHLSDNKVRPLLELI